MDDLLAFPFLAIVGQEELKTALIMALINPQIGGVLLMGPYGVGKTTAVRALIDLMPVNEYKDFDEQGTLVERQERMRIIELPLNAGLNDVLGGVNERVALEQQRVLLDEGVLAKAHRNLLYIDEVNLLDRHIADVILDAAAQGRTLVRRGAMTRLFATQFVLVGSMNPEEGLLRPQIMDRFALRVWVSPLNDPAARLELYRRVRDFRTDSTLFRRRYAAETEALAEEISAAREILPHVSTNIQAERFAMQLIQQLEIPSHRAEIALLEAARARAAADYRATATIDDVHSCALLALRQRKSSLILQHAEHMAAEDQAIKAALEGGE